MDLHSRRIVGWSVRPSLAKELATSALEAALHLRQPKRGLIHHSGQDSQYMSHRYQQFLRALFEYIEVFYNRQRRHSTLGCLTPTEYQERYIQRQTAAV